MDVVSRFDANKEFYTSERCHIVEIHNHANDSGCSIARARVEPGVATHLHSLRETVERYVILEGQGVVEVDDGAPQAVGPLDVVVIPEGASQRIENTGDTDLLFLCVCTPRFEQRNYIALD